MGKYKLIIVDDEITIRHGLGLLPWENMGFTLAGTFASGREALDFLSGNAVDVVLTDIVMPGGTGLDIAQWLHANCPETYVVFLSGYSDFHNAQEAIRYRVVRYLLKPTDIHQLTSLFLELKTLLDERTKENPPLDEGTLLGQINEYIDAHLAEGVTLTAVAGHVHLSQSHLSRLFKAQANMTFTDYLTLRRMETAKRLLRKTDMRVYGICELVGYRDERHFIKTFSRMVGISPSAYRHAGVR